MRSVYFGWLVVAASIMIYALVLGSTFASFGLFILPVSEEFGLSRAEINTGLIILNLGNAVMAPFVGRMLDRVPIKRIMACSAVLLGGSLMVLSVSHSLLLSSAVIAVPVALGLLGSGTLSVSVMIARWFTVYRGRAMALAAIGMSLGSIVVTPIVGLLIEAQGWRGALMLMGGAVVTLLLLLVLFLREAPGPNDVEVRSDAPVSPVAAARPVATDDTPKTAMQILGSPLFWVLAIGISLGTAASQGLVISLVPFAHEAGLSTMEAASLLSVAGVVGIGAMVCLSVVTDKVDRTIQLAAITVSGALPCALMLVADSYVTLLVASAAIGLSLAAVAPVYIALLADRFGLASFGTVRGLIVPIVSIFGALSMRFIGEIYDRTGGYDLGLVTYIVLDIVAAAMILFTLRMGGHQRGELKVAKTV